MRPALIACLPAVFFIMDCGLLVAGRRQIGLWDLDHFKDVIPHILPELQRSREAVVSVTVDELFVTAWQLFMADDEVSLNVNFLNVTVSGLSAFTSVVTDEDEETWFSDMDIYVSGGYNLKGVVKKATLHGEGSFHTKISGLRIDGASKRKHSSFIDMQGSTYAKITVSNIETQFDHIVFDGDWESILENLLQQYKNTTGMTKLQEE